MSTAKISFNINVCLARGFVHRVYRANRMELFWSRDLLKKGKASHVKLIEPCQTLIISMNGTKPQMSAAAEKMVATIINHLKLKVDGSPPSSWSFSAEQPWWQFRRPRGRPPCSSLNIPSKYKRWFYQRRYALRPISRAPASSSSIHDECPHRYADPSCFRLGWWEHSGRNASPLDSTSPGCFQVSRGYLWRSTSGWHPCLGRKEDGVCRNPLVQPCPTAPVQPWKMSKLKKFKFKLINIKNSFQHIISEQWKYT